MMKKVTMSFLALSVLVVSGGLPVMAACSWNAGMSPGERTRSITVPSNLEFIGTANIIRNASSIYAYEIRDDFGASTSNPTLVRCEAGDYLLRQGVSYSSEWVEGMGYLFKTNITGVFLRVRGDGWVVPDPTTGAGYQHPIASGGYTLTANELASNINNGGSIYTDIIMTPGIRSGGSDPGGHLLNMTAGGIRLFNITIPPFTVTAPACTIVSPNQTVEMGATSVSDLPTVGSASSAKHRFAISLNCPDKSLVPTITFDGTAHDDFASVFANAGTAKNVGILLTQNDTVIPPKGKFTASQAAVSGINAYDFDAQLFRVNSDKKGGTIDVTVTYQVDYA